MATNDAALTLLNVGMGRAEEEFQTEMRRVTDYLVENNQRLGEPKAKITLTIEIRGLRDEPNGPGQQGDILNYRLTVHGAKTTLPPRLGRAQRARLDGVDLVVDEAEIDADKTRALPFKKPQNA